jgi:hypothetical protein
MAPQITITQIVSMKPTLRAASMWSSRTDDSGNGLLLFYDMPAKPAMPIESMAIEPMPIEPMAIEPEHDAL